MRYINFLIGFAILTLTASVVNAQDDGDRPWHYVLTESGPVYYTDGYPNWQDNQQTATPHDVQREAPAPTIVENQPKYTPPPVRAYPTIFQRPELQSDGSVQRISVNEPQTSTILVFRDGHMIEIGNYVIGRDTLYNLAGDYRTHKILLADLDLDKTVKINKERGYDLKLPRSPGKN
jgi:hypothetical protein